VEPNALETYAIAKAAAVAEPDAATEETAANADTQTNAQTSIRIFLPLIIRWCQWSCLVIGHRQLRNLLMKLSHL
jgi:hypothetical protein